DNTYQGTFAIPTNSTLYDIKVISYSGPRWTDIISINNITIFNLSNYGNDYLELGDPYSFSINPSYANSTNTIKITTALSPTNSSEGSISNKIIYTIVKNITSYSSITSLAQGCEWNISFEDDSTITINVPSTYAESTKCTYNEITQTYDENDAMQSAAFNLLKEMDFDLNGKIDVKFSEQDLDISFSEITGIPFGWSTEVQVRKWH
ncbi:MAG: hypothetical protein HQ521_12585, partial [Bacteroidetes bacterium]|nr:hypothetical protein [Bacteroidota bacterium]